MTTWLALSAGLERSGVCLARASAGSSAWIGSTADATRALWAEQVGYLTRGAVALATAAQALDRYRAVLSQARAERAAAQTQLGTTSAAVLLLDPVRSGFDEYAAAQRRLAAADLSVEAAARRLADELAACERWAALPPPAPRPCVPEPLPKQPWWATVLFGPTGAESWDPTTCVRDQLLENGGPPVGFIRAVLGAEAAVPRVLADESFEALTRRVMTIDGFEHSLGRHSEQLIGRRAVTAEERHRWAQAVARAWRSTRVVPWTIRLGDGQLEQAIGRVAFDGRSYWLLVQRLNGTISTMYRLHGRQIGAVLREEAR